MIDKQEGEKNPTNIWERDLLLQNVLFLSSTIFWSLCFPTSKWRSRPLKSQSNWGVFSSLRRVIPPPPESNILKFWHCHRDVLRLWIIPRWKWASPSKTASRRYLNSISDTLMTKVNCKKGERHLPFAEVGDGVFFNTDMLNLIWKWWPQICVPPLQRNVRFDSPRWPVCISQGLYCAPFCIILFSTEISCVTPFQRNENKKFNSRGRSKYSPKLAVIQKGRTDSGAASIKE